MELCCFCLAINWAHYFLAAKLVQSPGPAWTVSQFVNYGCCWKVGDRLQKELNTELPLPMEELQVAAKPLCKRWTLLPSLPFWIRVAGHLGVLCSAMLWVHPWEPTPPELLVTNTTSAADHKFTQVVTRDPSSLHSATWLCVCTSNFMCASSGPNRKELH